MEGQAVAHGKKMTPQPARDEPYELPGGWVWATIADLVLDAQPGFASGKKGVEGGVQHLRMNNIGPDCRLSLSQVTRVPRASSTTSSSANPPPSASKPTGCCRSTLITRAPNKPEEDGLSVRSCARRGPKASRKWTTDGGTSG